MAITHTVTLYEIGSALYQAGLLKEYEALKGYAAERSEFITLMPAVDPEPWNQEPKYEHDCDSCTFLGSVVLANGVSDCYHCSYGNELVIRRSNELEDNIGRSLPRANQFGDSGFSEALGLYTRYTKRGFRSALI